MSGDMENFRIFVAEALSSTESLRRFKLAMQELASERLHSISGDLDSRQRDAIYGSVEMCFRIVDEAEEALNAIKENAKSGCAGGLLT